MGAEGESFGKVLLFKIFRVLKVGDGAGDFDDFEITAGGEIKFFRRFKQKLFNGRFQG